MGTIARDCDKDVTSGKMELTPLSERICGLKLVLIEPRSTHQKIGLYVGLPTGSFIGQGRTYDFL